MGPSRRLERASVHPGQPGSCQNMLKPGMAPEPIADHLSPQAELVEGWEQRGQEEGLGVAAASTPPTTSPHPHACLGAQSFYLRMGEQAHGSQATRTTPKPWESRTKGSRSPSRSDLWVERRTSGEPCLGRARGKCQPASTLMVQGAETSHRVTKGSAG